MTTPITPLFSLNSSQFTQISTNKVKQIDVYDTKKVVLIDSRGKSIEIKPEGFKDNYCSNADFLKKLQWRISEANDGTYFANAMPRLLGGGNTPTTSKKKADKNNKDHGYDLDFSEIQLLKEKINFSTDQYQDVDWRCIALTKACNIEDKELQLKILNILLNKMKIDPATNDGNVNNIYRYVFYSQLIAYSSKPVIENEDALQLFIKAGLPLEKIPLGDLLSEKLFKTFEHCIDAGVPLNQRPIKESVLSPFFKDKMPENKLPSGKYKTAPFFHKLVLPIADSYTNPQFFNYVKETRQDLGQYINTLDDDRSTLLMMMLQIPSSYSDMNYQVYDSRLEWLLSFKPNLTHRDSLDRTALFYLLMSADLEMFKKYLDLLIKNGLDLDQKVHEGLTQFTYCLELLLKTDSKYNADIWIERKHPGLLEKLALMVRLSSKPVPSDIYLQLPEHVRDLLDQSKSDTLSTSSGTDSPVSGSPTKTAVSTLRNSPFQELYGLIDPTLNPENSQIIALKATLEEAFKAQSLFGLLSQPNNPTVKSLFKTIINSVKILITQKTHENPTILRMMIDKDLSMWLSSQNNQTQVKKQSFDRAQIERATEEALRKMEAIQEKTRAEIEASKEAAERAAERARYNQNRANEAASRANSSATNAHISAMGAQFAQSTTVGK